MTRPNVTLWHTVEIILDIIGVQRYALLINGNNHTMPKTTQKHHFLRNINYINNLYRSICTPSHTIIHF